MRQLKVGPGTDPQSEMGPLVTRQHLDKVMGYVDLGVKEGAKLVVDGRGAQAAGLRERLLPRRLPVRPREAGHAHLQGGDLRPGALGRARATTSTSAIGLVNDHEYGNGTAIFTRDGDAARDFANNVKIGMVGINVPIPVPMAYPQLRRLEALAVRRPPHARPGRRALLHQAQDGDERWPTGIRAGAEYVMPTMR